MDKKLLQHIIEWDIQNWSKALDYWNAELQTLPKALKCLELGAGNGGLSLWLAMNEHNVICSDIELPGLPARQIHEQYNCCDRITYEAINAIEIPYDNYFDLVVFKSMLGGISRYDNTLKRSVMEQIHKALKPRGRLLFAENLSASTLHRYLRNRYVRWGSNWNYLRTGELEDILSSYSRTTYKTAGFLGNLGRTEKQRKILGMLDTGIEKIVPGSMRYIVYGIAEK